MALTTVVVTGNIHLPDGAVPDSATLEFRLVGNGFDMTSNEVIPQSFIADDLNVSTGAFTANLWPNDRGSLATYYQCILTFTGSSRGKKFPTQLGDFQVPEAGAPHEFATLRTNGVISANSVIVSQLTQEQYDAVVDTVINAEAVESYASQAEAARDAAFVNADVYDDTTAGIAGTSNGEQFQVVDESGDYIQRYLNNGGTAEVVDGARYPSAAFVEESYKQVSQGASFKDVVASSGTITVNSDLSVSVSANGYVMTNIVLPQDILDAGVLTVYCHTQGGQPLDAASSWLSQRTATNVTIGSNHTFVEMSDGVGRRDITLDPTCTQVRLYMKAPAGSAARFVGPSLIAGGGSIGHVSSDPVLKAKAILDISAADGSNTSNIWNPVSITTTSGPTGSEIVGRDISVVADSIVEVACDIDGVVTQTDRIGFLLKVSGGIPKQLELYPRAEVSGGYAPASVVFPRHIGDGWYWAVSEPCAAGTSSNLDPENLTLRISADVLASGFGLADLTISDIWMGLNATTPPMAVKTPTFVTDALSAAGVSTVYVDPLSGSDVNSGSLASPLATIAKAVELGASRIGLRRTRHKITAALSWSGMPTLDLFSYAAAGTTEQHAIIDASFDHELGDFTATAADSNVLFLAMATDPVGAWEKVTSTGVYTKLGKDNPSRTGQTIMNASEAEVRATAGSAWWGAGSEGTGLYIRPFGDVTTGKTWHTPVDDFCATFSNIGVVRRTGVAFHFGREYIVEDNFINLEHSHCQYAYSGHYNGHFVDTDTYTNITGEGNEFFMNQEDGQNVNGNCRVIEIGSVFRDNGGDGMSPHFRNNDITFIGCEFLRNKKQGFVTVGGGTFKLHGNIAHDNNDRDFYIGFSADYTLTAELIGNYADDTYIFRSNDPSQANVTIYDHRGAIELGADATIVGHRCRESTVGPCLSVSAGTVSVADFNYQKSNVGISVSGGTLTASQGHVMRNNIGVRVTGGTLVFDADDPVNVNGNTTQYLGVDPAVQAEALSFQAI